MPLPPLAVGFDEGQHLLAVILAFDHDSPQQRAAQDDDTAFLLPAGKRQFASLARHRSGPLAETGCRCGA